MKKLLFAFTCSLLLAGCISPLRPGRASFKSPSGVEGSVVQSQNPQQETTQKYERITEPMDAPAVKPALRHGLFFSTKQTAPVVTPPQPERVRVTERVETKIGAAQKDTGREMAAKLSSLKGVVWVGILVFLFGAASLVYPPLKMIVASTTTSALAIVSGIGMMALPSLIVGNEVLIMGAGIGIVVLWFFAHRHGKVSGELKSLKEKL